MACTSLLSPSNPRRLDTWFIGVKTVIDSSRLIDVVRRFDAVNDNSDRVIISPPRKLVFCRFVVEPLPWRSLPPLGQSPTK